MRKSSEHNLRRSLLMMLLAVLLVLYPLAGFRIQANAENSSSKTINLKYDVAGATLHLYKIADLNSDGTYTLCGDFADYAVDLTDLTSEKLSSIAHTLEGYVALDSISADQSGVVAADNTLRFSVASNGIYLILGDRLTAGNTTYYPQPAITTMPCSDTDGNISFTPSMEIKYTTTVTPPPEETTPETVSISAYKIWDDDSNSDSIRPSSITVDLLCDGSVLSTAELNSENNWFVSWSDLAEDHSYLVVEESVPSGYTVSVSQSETTFVITNTHTPTEETTTPPTTTTTSIPQTGSEWYMVMILALSGCGLMAAGFAAKRKQGR